MEEEEEGRKAEERSESEREKVRSKLVWPRKRKAASSGLSYTAAGSLL